MTKDKSTFSLSAGSVRRGRNVTPGKPHPAVSGGKWPDRDFYGVSAPPEPAISGRRSAVQDRCRMRLVERYRMLELAANPDSNDIFDSPIGPDAAMKKIAVLAYDGCWAMSVFSATDFFRIVALLNRHLRLPDSYQVEVLTADGREARSASGHVIVPDRAIDGNAACDLIVIPPVEGIRLSHGFEPDERIVSWLRAKKLEGARLLAMTTGAVHVAATGLADGILMATHWAFVRHLKTRYPGCRFVAQPSCLHADGIWTTGTLNGTFDALLEFVAQDKGDQFAQLCATHLLVAPPERLTPVLPGHRNHCDDAILQVQDWIEAHYAQAITIERMSREAGMAGRTLKRRFQRATGLPPNLYVQKVRVEKAKKLLLATGLSIKAIAHEAGYENVSFFVRVFKKQVGLTPAQWRKCEAAVQGQAA